MQYTMDLFSPWVDGVDQMQTNSDKVVLDTEWQFLFFV